MTYTDIIITVVILAAVLWSAHRMGQANPVGTGRLARRMDALEAKVGQQGEKIEGLERAVLLLSTASETTARSIEALRIEAASDRGTIEKTWGATNRLETFFLESAFKGRQSS